MKVVNDFSCTLASDVSASRYGLRGKWKPEHVHSRVSTTPLDSLMMFATCAVLETELCVCVVGTHEPFQSSAAYVVSEML